MNKIENINQTLADKLSRNVFNLIIIPEMKKFSIPFTCNSTIERTVKSKWLSVINEIWQISRRVFDFGKLVKRDSEVS